MIKTFGIVEDEVKKQLENALKSGGERAVLCADNHIGYSVPIGAVIAYEGQISPSGVGYDIACGNKAVLLDCDGNSIQANIYRTMNEIAKNISFGMGGKNKEKIEHELFDDPLWDEIPLLKGLKDKARSQFGTVGSGNHYVDILNDEQGRIWIGVHFGSRGLGHSIATHYIKAGGGVDGIHTSPVVFDVGSTLGDEYIECMNLAGRYAYAGRDWVCKKVAELLRGEIIDEVHNHHNFAWFEEHDGTDYWVVRKGATPAFPGQKGFVGGSMGDYCFILEGKDSAESAEALYSTVHGAGRVMGRREAAGKTCWKTGKKLTEGKVIPEEHNLWIKNFGVEVRGGGLDESPIAYKRLGEVIEYHSNTINILHTLKPIGVAMAPPNERRGRR